MQQPTKKHTQSEIFEFVAWAFVVVVCVASGFFIGAQAGKQNTAPIEPFRKDIELVAPPDGFKLKCIKTENGDIAWFEKNRG